ncbi:hypothetical protein D3C72_2521610 [compost metagenome]
MPVGKIAKATLQEGTVDLFHSQARHESTGIGRALADVQAFGGRFAINRSKPQAALDLLIEREW